MFVQTTYKGDDCKQEINTCWFVHSVFSIMKGFSSFLRPLSKVVVATKWPYLTVCLESRRGKIYMHKKLFRLQQVHHECKKRSPAQCSFCIWVVVCPLSIHLHVFFHAFQNVNTAKFQHAEITKQYKKSEEWSVFLVFLPLHCWQCAKKSRCCEDTPQQLSTLWCCTVQGLWRNDIFVATTHKSSKVLLIYSVHGTNASLIIIIIQPVVLYHRFTALYHYVNKNPCFTFQAVSYK